MAFFIAGKQVTVNQEANDKGAKPALMGAGQARAKQRENRQAAALRDNLSRRKTQSRDRVSADDGAESAVESAEGRAKPKA